MERKADRTLEERKQYRLKNYRAELKTRESSDFIIIAPGKKDVIDSARSLATLETIRKVVYTELARGIRMDRNQVRILRRQPS